jgi:hypothetical protein
VLSTVGFPWNGREAEAILFIIIFIFIPTVLLSLLSGEEGEMWAGDEDDDQDEEDGSMRKPGVVRVPAASQPPYRRARSVIRFNRASSGGLHVITSGSSLKAL